MRRQTLAVLGAAVTVAAAVPALAQDVTYDYDNSFDFTKVRTYAWVEGAPVEDELNHRRIVEAIEAQLAARQLRATGEGAPDVSVSYCARFDKTLRIDGFGTGWGGPRWGGMRSVTAYVGEVLGGAIVVEMKDARTAKIVWRGMVRKEIDMEASPDKRDKHIGRAVERLFRTYPVPAGK